MEKQGRAAPSTETVTASYAISRLATSHRHDWFCRKFSFEALCGMISLHD
jgi:hypothetical protein